MARKTTGKAGGPASPGARERILEAAAEVISEKGFAGTRLADVAEVAGLQAPALYYYFDSRVDLIAQVLYEGQDRLQTYVDAALDAVPDGADPLVRLDTVIRSHLEVELRESFFARAVSRNGSQMPEPIRELLRAKARTYLDLWDRELRRLQDGGLVPGHLDPRIVRMMIVGSLNQAAEWFRPEHGDFEEVVTTAQYMARGALGLPATTRVAVSSAV
jgi:AcrR family transcriptional regulator